MTQTTSAGSLIPPWLRNRWGVLVALAAVYIGGYALWTFLHQGMDEETVSLISNIVFLPLSFLATMAALLRVAAGPYDGELRRAWFLIGLALFAYFLGDVLWFFLESVQKLPEELLYPSNADVFYLTLFPLMLWGLLILSGRGATLSRTERLKVALDLLIVTATAWMVVWYFAISPAVEAAAEDTVLGQIVATAYPLGDLAILFGVSVIVLRGADANTRAAMFWLSLGAVAFVATDLVYAYLDLQGLYSSGDPIDVGWLLAYLFFTLAALRQAYNAPVPAEANVAAPHRWTVALPFLAIGVGYGLMLYLAAQLVQMESRITVVLVSVGLLTFGVISRQMIALRENAKLNAELRAFSTELEERVTQRTLELKQSQEALVASQKMASVGTMAAGVVHEVSNPLNTIITASEMLESELGQKAPDVEQIKTYLPIITRSAWHAARIMQALRTFSRGSNPELRPYSLNEIIEDALLLAGFQIKRAGPNPVNLQLDLAPELPPVVCDRNQIAQVVINLLNNARDAMPDGGTVNLRTRLMLAGVTLQVVDQGVGMTPEVVSKIFDPFYTTKEVGKGMGLGLSICAGIMRAHKGDIAAYSDGPGRGATFTITLPLATAREPRPTANP